jgi:hypothetical protein
VEAERMPNLVVDNTEQAAGKLKNWKGFSKPNFETGPKPDLGWWAGLTADNKRHYYRAFCAKIDLHQVGYFMSVLYFQL